MSSYKVKGKMNRTIVQMFRRGELTPMSHLIEIPSIGPYLYRRLRRTLSPNTRELTVRMFAHRIRRMDTARLKRTLQRALQNNRNNMCVTSHPRRPDYHVSDYNVRGCNALFSLIRVLHSGQDGHGLGHNFAFDITRIRMPPYREDDSKTLPCLSRGRCRRAGGVFSDGLCQPTNRVRGFDGVSPFSGQRRNAGSPQPSRGRYARHPDGNTKWRRPGHMRKVPMRQG